MASCGELPSARRAGSGRTARRAALRSAARARRRIDRELDPGAWSFHAEQEADRIIAAIRAELLAFGAGLLSTLAMGSRSGYCMSHADASTLAEFVPPLGTQVHAQSGKSPLSRWRLPEVLDPPSQSTLVEPVTAGTEEPSCAEVVVCGSDTDTDDGEALRVAIQMSLDALPATVVDSPDDGGDLRLSAAVACSVPEDPNLSIDEGCRKVLTAFGAACGNVRDLCCHCPMWVQNHLTFLNTAGTIAWAPEITPSAVMDSRAVVAPASRGRRWLRRRWKFRLGRMLRRLHQRPSLSRLATVSDVWSLDDERRSVLLASCWRLGSRCFDSPTCSRILINDSHILVVLALYGKVIAYAHFAGTADGTIDIDQLGVLKRFRGRGLGSSLVSHIRSWSAQQGYTTVGLWSLETSVGFWERTGFEHTGTREDGCYRMFSTIRHSGASSSASACSLDTAVYGHFDTDLWRD